jgi:hypothetical protein
MKEKAEGKGIHQSYLLKKAEATNNNTRTRRTTKVVKSSKDYENYK